MRHSLKTITLSGLFAIVPLLPSNALELRTWTNLKGQKIEAEFVRLDGDKVLLKSKDGTMFKPLKLTDLSKADQDYLKEVATAKPAFGPPPRENKKVANPAKEAKFDKKTAFVPVSDRQFEIPTVKFFILESEHFAVFYEKKGKDFAEEYAETCERMWLDMNFFHPTFASKFQDRKMPILLCDSDETFKKVGKWYADLIAASGQPNAVDAASRIDNSFKQSSSSGINIPGELAEQHKILTHGEVAKSFREGQGGRPQRSKGVFDPFRVHSVASMLFDLQAGGASDFAKEGWSAISIGHAYFKEINITGICETALISGDGGSGGDVQKSPIYENNWADNLRKAIRKDWKPTMAMLWGFSRPDSKPEGNATMYAWAAYLQSTPDRITKYAELVSRIDTGHQVPSQEDVAKLYGFETVAAMEQDWLAYIKSSNFK